MNVRKAGYAVGALLAAAVAGVSHAHHSTAEFDYSKNVSLDGQVVEVQWMNPHSFIEIYVPPQQEGEEATRWSIEYGSPNILRRMGWKRTTIKPGDQVHMEIAPTRDGLPRGTLRELTLPNGEKKPGIAGLTTSDDKGAPLINPDAIKSNDQNRSGESK